MDTLNWGNNNAERLLGACVVRSKNQITMKKPNIEFQWE